MTLMLASVLSRAEAEIALAQGADIIDCKDPARGALGALAVEEVRRIVALVDGRRPVSAVAELHHDVRLARQAIEDMAAAGADFVKFALPITPDAEEIIDEVAPLAHRINLVAVLFADLGPDFAVLDSLARAGFYGAMLDTAHKGKGRLINHMGVDQLGDFVRQCRERSLKAGLAGSLEAPDVPRLLVLRPDILGFRGALCETGNRRQSISAQAVTLIRDLMPGMDRPAVARVMGSGGGLDLSLLAARGYAKPAPVEEEVDYVYVRDLAMPVEIGAYEFERGHTQRVRFNVEVAVSRVSGPDDMRTVFSYDVIMDAIKMILAAGHIELVETIAERLAESVLLHERVRAVTVEVEKLDVVEGAVGVRIKRDRPREPAPKIAHLFPGFAKADESES